MATLGLKERMLKIARERSDDWGFEVIGKLECVRDLEVNSVKYHLYCKRMFESNQQKSSVDEVEVRIQY